MRMIIGRNLSCFAAGAIGSERAAAHGGYDRPLRSDIPTVSIDRHGRATRRMSISGIVRNPEIVFSRLPATMTGMADLRLYSDHRRIDERSLAMHRLIARKVLADPGLLDIARENLRRWQCTVDSPSPALAEWGHILNGPADQVARFLEEPSERATRLRQSSSFCGILTDAERRAIYESYSARTYHPGREPDFGRCRNCRGRESGNPRAGHQEPAADRFSVHESRRVSAQPSRARRRFIPDPMIRTYTRSCHCEDPRARPTGTKQSRARCDMSSRLLPRGSSPRVAMTAISMSSDQ
jgi:hypothetical protein